MSLLAAFPVSTASAPIAMDWPLSIADAASRLRSGLLSSEALTRHYLAGIEKLQPKLNAFITVTAEQALTTAVERDKELRLGVDRGPLHGIPIVHKDNFDTAGVRTTIGSEIFRFRVPVHDASAVGRLAKAGVVMLGKANMNEFAAGPSGKNQAFGDTRNPWNIERSPGGTSSGTAVAVAAGLCLGGTGTDTGGSIRIPASWTGITGLRPTFGRTDMKGIFPRAHSLDCAGPLARSAADVAALFYAMTTSDPGDWQSLNQIELDFSDSAFRGLNGFRVGVINAYTFREIDGDVAQAVASALNTLQELGAEVRHVNIPLLQTVLDYRLMFRILLFEFSEILGGTYYSTPDRAVFGPTVRSDMARAAQVSADDYQQALAARARYLDELHSVFGEVDALVTPTMPTTALTLTTPLEDFDRGRQFTLPSNFLGLPSLSVPCAFDSQGLPIGLQLVGDRLSEAVILRIGHAFQRATDFHMRRPSCHWGRAEDTDSDGVA